MGKKFTILFFICCFVCSGANADQPGPVSQPVIPQVQTQFKLPVSNSKIFALGRSIGASYYHLIDLYSKSANKPFLDLQKEYSDTFQNFNIIDIILNDLDIKGTSRQDLNKIRKDFYDSLKKQDLSETQLAYVRDSFIIFYENLIQDIKAQYFYEGSWFLSLGFYTSFQLESLISTEQEKIFLSGFDKILSARPIQVPEDIYASLLKIYSLDKPTILQSELNILKANLVNITEYFTNYPHDITGIWQGILVNPEKEKYDISLTVDNDLNAKMNIAGIAGNVEICDVHIVNNYFTFMFKPFGTETLFLRFDAKLSDNIFTGEITDVLGEKGYWVLAKTDKNKMLSDQNLDKMTSYIAQIEQKLRELPVNEIKTDPKLLPVAETEVVNEIPVQNEQINEIIEEVKEINLPSLEEGMESPVIEEPMQKQTFWQRFKNFLDKIF